MASFPSSLSRSCMCNSPFTPEQSSWIVLMYGEVKLLKQVRRTFRLHFCRVSNRKIARIPNLLAFSMAWLGIVAGKCLQAHWFDGAVDGAAYLDILKTVVWPAVRHQATRLQYWFQQDGASPQITEPVMDFLRSKFGDRIISRKSEHHWPPYSPDLSCLDFSIRSEVMAHVV